MREYAFAALVAVMSAVVVASAVGTFVNTAISHLAVVLK